LIKSLKAKTTLLHLNEMSHFDKKKRHCFDQTLTKKRGKPDILFIIPYLLPEKVARVTMFLEHLMLHLSTKLDKPYTIMMA